MDRQIAEIKNTKSSPLTLGLYAMNGFSGQSSSNGVLMAEEMARKYREVYEYSYATSARSTEPIYLTGYEERQHHHRPVSFGLTLSYPLTERLSLTTGLVYTKLSSDFTQVMNKMQIRRRTVKAAVQKQIRRALCPSDRCLVRIVQDTEFFSRHDS